MSFNILEILGEVLDRCPQWYEVANLVDFREDPDTDLIRNDGRNIFYNGRRLQRYTIESQYFFLAQQLLQVQLAHQKRGEGKDVRCWLRACYAVSGAMVVRDGFEQPANVMIPPEAKDLSVDEYYEILLKNSDEDDEDEHFDPDSDKRREEEEVIEKEKEEIFDRRGGEEKGAQIREIDDPALARALDDLADLLEPSMQIDYDWFPGDTIRDGMIRERFKPYQVPHAEILLDTSASIDSDLLRSFVSSVKGLLREDAVVKVGCFDTEFYGFQEVRNDEDIKNLEMKGAGGTNFETAINAFTGDAETRIIFTDGYAEMPLQRCDAIWLVYSDIPVHPNGGHVIYVKDPKEIVEHEIDFLIT